MEILLEIDDAKCAKCGKTGQMLPEIIVRHKDSFRVQRATLPEGWAAGHDGALLCDACITAWKKFVAPAPAPKNTDLGKLIPVPQKATVDTIAIKAAQPTVSTPITPAATKTGEVVQRTEVDNNGNPLVRHGTVNTMPDAKNVQKIQTVIKAGPPVTPNSIQPVPQPIQRPPTPMQAKPTTVQQGRVMGATPHASSKTFIEKTMPMPQHGTTEVSVAPLTDIAQMHEEIVTIEPMTAEQLEKAQNL